MATTSKSKSMLTISQPVKSAVMMVLNENLLAILSEQTVIPPHIRPQKNGN